MVGAGLAGLRTALGLLDSGIGPIVLEAGAEVGGRVRSSRLANGSGIELGAEWVLPGNSELRTLAERFGVELVPTRTDYRRRTPAGPGAPSFSSFEAAAAAVGRRRAELDGDPATRRTSVADLFDAVAAGPGVDPAAVRTVRMRLQGTATVDLSLLPVASLDPDDLSLEPAVYERCQEGNQSLATSIADHLPDVRLRHSVTAVLTGEGGARVVARRADGHEVSVEADAAAIAVPVSVIASIEFDPPLPAAVLDAARRRPFGVASKLAIAIAPGAEPRSLQSARIPMWCWVGAGPGGVPRPNLTAFCGSPLAHEMLGLDAGDPAIWLERLAELAPDLTFEGTPRLQVWSEEPFVRGAYSALDGPSLERLPSLQTPQGPGDRIVLAGEHTADPEHTGTMEGALRSGSRAAEQLLEVLR